MSAKKSTSKKTGKHSAGTKPAKKYASKHPDDAKSQGVSDVQAVYKKSAAHLHKQSFSVTIGGKKKYYTVDTGYGYFIAPFRMASSLADVAASIDNGLPSKEIGAITEYLGFKVPDIARAASVSTSTVSRWEPDTSIGIPGANQFFKIDELIRKGVSLFGGEDEFKSWLISPNLALGNKTPAQLATSLIGVELVDEALDALAFGTVM